MHAGFMKPVRSRCSFLKKNGAVVVGAPLVFVIPIWELDIELDECEDE